MLICRSILCNTRLDLSKLYSYIYLVHARSLTVTSVLLNSVPLLKVEEPAVTLRGLRKAVVLR
jgi:hypothetical protein